MAKQQTSGRGTLSTGALVEAALAIADAEGLDAVTIRRLAGDHGVTPMAMYWHFRDKEQLLDSLAERLLGDVVAPAVGDGPWQERLHGELSSLLAAVRPHPAVADLALTRILSCRPGLVVAERILALLRSAGFEKEEAAEIGTYVVCALITLVTCEPGRELSPGDEDREALLRAKRASLGALSPEDFPNVIAVADILTEPPSEDRYLARGVDLLVEGTRSLLPR